MNLRRCKIVDPLFFMLAEFYFVEIPLSFLAANALPNSFFSIKVRTIDETISFSSFTSSSFTQSCTLIPTIKCYFNVNSNC